MSGVSVVVPTYNRADLLRLTLRSVLGQTVAPLEVIVVDDGSTDHTPEICSEFGDSIRYLRQENQRLSGARNTGIRAARGDWLAFCDSDDLWHRRKLEVQLAALKETGAGWSLTDFGLIGPDGNRRDNITSGFSHLGHGFHNLTPDQHFRRWLRPCKVQMDFGSVLIYQGDAFGMLFEGNVALPSTSIVAKALIDRAGPFDRTFRAEETEFFHRLAAYAPVAIVMESLADYRVGHASLITGDPAPFVQDALRSNACAALLRPTLTTKERSAFHEGRRRLRNRLAYAQLSSLDRAGARQTIYEGWREHRFVSLRAVAIVMASLLPERILRGLHLAKRTMQGHVK